MSFFASNGDFVRISSTLGLSKEERKCAASSFSVPKGVPQVLHQILISSGKVIFPSGLFRDVTSNFKIPSP